MVNTMPGISTECESAGLNVLFHEWFQARLIDGDNPAFKVGNLLGIDINTADCMSGIRENGSMY